MSLESFLQFATSSLPAARGASCASPSAGLHASRACLDHLEARRLLSAGLAADALGTPGGGADEAGVTASARSNTISDPRGDFLSTYTGPHAAGLDVVAHQVTLSGDRVIFFGKMAGPIAPTQEVGGLYIFGVDRGRGTPRFRAGAPVIGPNVLWDLIVRINPDGSGLVNNQAVGVVTPLDPADIRISGTQFSASVPLSVLQNGATRPPEEWTYNLWPRNGIVPGQNVHVSDLAPDDGNSPVQVLSRNGSAGFGGFGKADAVTPAEGVRGSVDGFSNKRIADEVLGTGDGSVLA